MTEESNGKQKTLFLIRDASKWRYFQNFYEEAQSRGDHITVVAVPYQYKNALGVPEGEILEEGRCLPKDLPIMSAKDYEISKECPDMVYTQDPFDAFSLATVVDDKFFTSAIRPYVKRILFVFPYTLETEGAADEMSREMLKAYLDTPGCFVSDAIYVFDENVRELFLSVFSEIYDSKLSQAFEKKLIVSQKKPVIKKSLTSGETKKNLLFVDSISCFIGKESLLSKKYASLMETFQGAGSRVNILWVKEAETEKIKRYLPEDVQISYDMFSKTMEEAEWCTVLEHPSKEELNEVLSVVDAAYGTPDFLLTECVSRNIPVMVWNLNV